MIVDSISDQARQLDAILLELGEGKLRVLDKYARVACDVAAGDHYDAKVAVQQIQDICQGVGRTAFDPHVRLVIDVVLEAVALDGAQDAVVSLSEFSKNVGRVEIFIHFEQAPSNWSALCGFVRSVREASSVPHKLLIWLSGPFRKMEVTEMEEMFALAIHPRYAGWQSECPSGQELPIDKAALTAMAEFGFRVPFVWYVHSGNLSLFDDVIADSLNLTYDSGFSLPLVSASPYYNFRLGFPELPDASEYCWQLVRSYQRYPYFDDVFSPLDELAFLAKNGGWHVGTNTTVNWRLIIHGDGQVGVYRQSPALCLPWIHINEIASIEVDELDERFLEFSENWLQWEKNAFCRGCRWRTVCGGLDAFSDLPAIATKQLDTMCMNRMLFLEHFAGSRASTHVVGMLARESGGPAPR